jgi:hypothetical protein
LRIDPNVAAWYDNVAFTTFALQRFDETRATLDAASQQKVDHCLFHASWRHKKAVQRPPNFRRFSTGIVWN